MMVIISGTLGSKRPSPGSRINGMKSRNGSNEMKGLMISIGIPQVSICTIVGIHPLNDRMFKLRSRHIPWPMNLTR